jgi:rare lipoprotein A
MQLEHLRGEIEHAKPSLASPPITAVEMTCAHRTRPFGSIVTVTHAGHSIQCRVNDRGPFVRGRVIDVSVSAARALGMMRSGVVRVFVE